MMKLDIPRTRSLLQKFEFKTLFIEELGWSQPSVRKPTALVHDGVEFEIRQIAELAGVVVLEIIARDASIPNAKTRAAVHKLIAKQHHENLLIFLDQHRTTSLWYWTKRESGKTYPREHLYLQGQPGDLFLSKLSAMVFDISEFDETGRIPIVEVAGRLRNALDVEQVTKKFYREFSEQHLAFLEYIKGVDNEQERRWYASVLLNRLMFIYFLQRKGFVDNGHYNYLQTKLNETQQQLGPNQYFGKFLKLLFFEGFAKPEEKRTAEARKHLGSIRYLNGGLFLPHKVEQEYPKLDVADRAFENLFKLFERYSWNLNDTPGGQDNEINPDVLGYIFEKYINQKAFGAYYTRPEITEYLSEATIYRLVLNAINDSETIKDFHLPGVKAYHYQAIPDLLMDLDAPLCRKLLHEVLPNLSLLDPACGSGAFLVAAMKTLINLYAAIIGKIKFLHDRNLSSWLSQAEREHKSLSYFIKKRIITDNLYGVDIMEEATEIAKLRLFLALVASAESEDQLEPLPNIDFNVLTGNSLIGLMRVTEEDFERQYAQGKLYRQSYRQVLEEKNRLIDTYRHATTYA
ncbi:MAG: ATP-binding protein, partial [Verrucomicrobia bacterium]|nr:ATP-binding protein [Verrucomicrobiota bacterium]